MCVRVRWSLSAAARACTCVAGGGLLGLASLSVTQSSVQGSARAGLLTSELVYVCRCVSRVLACVVLCVSGVLVCVRLACLRVCRCVSRAQGERDWVLQQFKSGQCAILVATDVAARGLGSDGVCIKRARGGDRGRE